VIPKIYRRGSGWEEKGRGRFVLGPAYHIRRPSGLLIALLLVEPVFGTGKVFRPVILVELTPPDGFCLFVVRCFPGEVSASLPWIAILLAHRVLRDARYRTMRYQPRNAGPGHPGSGPSAYLWQVMGRAACCVRNS